MKAILIAFWPFSQLLFVQLFFAAPLLLLCASCLSLFPISIAFHFVDEDVLSNVNVSSPPLCA